MTGTTACKWDSVIPFTYHILNNKGKTLYLQDALMAGFTLDYFNENKKAGMWERLNKLIKPNGAIVLFGSEPFSSALRMSNIKNYKYDWIWEKSKATGFALCKNRPLKAHEMVHIFSSKKECYYPQKTEGKPYQSKLGKKESLEMSTGTTRYDNKDGKRYPRSVQYFKTSETERNGYNHPTQKPVALMEYLIKTYTNENELVLDFTMGSGSTGVACKNLNRDFIGIELDEVYFKIGKERIGE
jgi:site-specific DNA-methyltransferase (adenine-specific)